MSVSRYPMSIVFVLSFSVCLSAETRNDRLSTAPEGSHGDLCECCSTSAVWPRFPRPPPRDSGARISCLRRPKMKTGWRPRCGFLPVTLSRGSFSGFRSIS